MRSNSRGHYRDDSGLTCCSRCFGADHRSSDCAFAFAPQCHKCNRDFSMALYHRPDKCDQVQTRIRHRMRGRADSKKLDRRSHALNPTETNNLNTISVNKLECFVFPCIIAQHKIKSQNSSLTFRL